MRALMIDWNIVLYIGMGLLISGFGLFLYSEMKIREIDRKLAQNERLMAYEREHQKWLRGKNE